MPAQLFCKFFHAGTWSAATAWGEIIHSHAMCSSGCTIFVAVRLLSRSAKRPFPPSPVLWFPVGEHAVTDSVPSAFLLLQTPDN